MPSGVYLKSVGIVLVVLLCMTVFVQHQQTEALREKLHASTELAETQAATITDMQQQNEKMAKLAVNYAKDYEDAQSESANLQLDIANDVKRVRVSANCKQPVSAKSGTESSDNAATARLTKDAERNYLHLRRQIEESRIQIVALQGYIKALPAQCVAKGEGDD